MAHWQSVNFDCPESQLLADIEGIWDDLWTTFNMCDLLSEKLNRIKNHSWDSSDLLIVDALSCAAVVRYWRVFASGRRKPNANDIIPRLCQELQEDHKWFTDFRNKFVAHSVNTFEENTVNAHLVPEDHDEKGIAWISGQSMKVLSLNIDDIHRLKRLAKAVLTHIEILREAENAKVLAFARSLPAEDFYKRLAEPPKWSKLDVSKDRSQKKRRKNV